MHLQDANLKDLSEQLYMNSSYISQLYKQKTGRNFSDYLLDVRMQKAAELLKSTSWKIYSVGKLVGYSNAKNFARAFLAFYHQTPTEYRDAARSGIASFQEKNS